jgi:hypothetical protein
MILLKFSKYKHWQLTRRLYKAHVSATLFGCVLEADSLRAYAATLLDQGCVLSYNGKNYETYFRRSAEVPAAEETMALLSQEAHLSSNADSGGSQISSTSDIDVKQGAQSPTVFYWVVVPCLVAISAISVFAYLNSLQRSDKQLSH